MENRIRSFLAELGISTQESEAYEIALGLGTFAASTIAARLGVPRSTARYTCESLVRKWLMIETKKANTKLFVAENPTKLFSIIYEQEAEVARRKEQLSLTVKELQKNYNPQAKLPKITFYEGIDGIGRMFDELLTHPTELYSFGAGDYFLSKEPELINDFRKKAKKVYRNVYVMRSPKYKVIHTTDTPSKQNRYFKSIDELKVDIQIVDDLMTIATIEGAAPIGIVIKHAVIVGAFKSIFEEMWKNS